MPRERHLRSLGLSLRLRHTTHCAGKLVTYRRLNSLRMPQYRNNQKVQHNARHVQDSHLLSLGQHVAALLQPERSRLPLLRWPRRRSDYGLRARARLRKFLRRHLCRDWRAAARKEHRSHQQIINRAIGDGRHPSNRFTTADRPSGNVGAPSLQTYKRTPPLWHERHRVRRSEGTP